MRRVLLRWVPFAVVATLVVLVVLLAAPIDRELVLRIYALVVGGLALATLTAATGSRRRRTKSQFAAALRTRPARYGRPEELERLERHVALSIENAADFHYRLRRTLVEATDAAVWRRYGVPLDAGRGPDARAPVGRRSPRLRGAHGPPRCRAVRSRRSRPSSTRSRE